MSSSASARAKAPTVRFSCTACGSANTFDADFEDGTICCGACEAPHAVACSAALRAGGPLDRCPVCSRSDFWRRKDFPRKLGLGIVAVAAVLAFYTYGISLVVASLVDAGLYLFLRDLAVCYSCRAEVRGVSLPKAVQAFDLPHQDEVEEKLATERRGGVTRASS